MRRLVKGPLVDREEMNALLAKLEGDTAAAIASAIAAIPAAAPLTIPNGYITPNMLSANVTPYITATVPPSAPQVHQLAVPGISVPKRCVPTTTTAMPGKSYPGRVVPWHEAAMPGKSRPGASYPGDLL